MALSTWIKPSTLSEFFLAIHVLIFLSWLNLSFSGNCNFTSIFYVSIFGMIIGAIMHFIVDKYMHLKWILKKESPFAYITNHDINDIFQEIITNWVIVLVIYGIGVFIIFLIA